MIQARLALSEVLQPVEVDLISFTLIDVKIGHKTFQFRQHQALDLFVDFIANKKREVLLARNAEVLFIRQPAPRKQGLREVWRPWSLSSSELEPCFEDALDSAYFRIA